MAKKRNLSKKPTRRPGKAENLIPKGYDELLLQLKERIRSAQLRAAWPSTARWSSSTGRSAAISSSARPRKDGGPR